MKNNYLYKVILMILTFVLVLSCTVFAEDSEYVLSDLQNNYIRVGVVFGNKAKDSIRLESDLGFMIVSVASGGWSAVSEPILCNELYASKDDQSDNILIKNKDDSIHITLNAGQGLMALGDDPDNLFLEIDDKKFRDGASFSLNADGTVNAANYLSVEHYVWGVINIEIGHTYPIEAIKAQAVTARTYAYANMGKHSKKYDFDVCNDSDCQSYGGVSSEHEACSAACRETKDMVITYNGALAGGYYYANSGGQTLASEDAWVSAVPYLRPIKDEYSPEYLWSSSFTFDEVMSRLVKAGISIGDVTDISVYEKTDYDAVLSLLIKGTDGEYIVSKGQMKSLFSLKSQLFELVCGDDDAPVLYNSNKVFRIDSDGNLIESPTKDLRFTDGNSILSYADLDKKGLYVIGAETETNPDEFVVFNGRGSGHGVGFSQTGANAMAQAGKNFEEILKYYYTGIEIKTYER